MFVVDTQRVGGEWSAQMYRLFRLDPAHGLPSQDQWLQLVHPEDRERMAHSREQTPDPRADFVQHEYRVKFGDGEVRWLSQRVRHETIEDRSVLFGITIDVTERILAERSKRIDHESAALSALSVGMAAWRCDSANGMSVWDDAVFRLRGIEPRRPAPSEDEPPTLTQPGGRNTSAAGLEATRERRHATGPVQPLPTDAEALSLAPSLPVGVAEAVREALLFVEGPARCARVTLQTGSLEGVVSGDRAVLRQMLVHLLSHAIKHNREGSQATIHSSVGTRTVTLTVQGHGPRWDAEQIAPTFEPGGRSEVECSDVEGTDLELSAVASLIGQMGGQLRVSNEPGRGTRFEVELPLGTGQPTAGGTPPTIQRSVATHEVGGAWPKPARLLYIEDNPVNALLVQELVIVHTLLDIVIEENGTLGVARARQMLPDLVLIDMQLPDFDGFEVLRRLKADPETAKLTCVALSANAVPAYIARAMAAGFDDYWTKPIDFKEFIGALERLFPNAVHLTPLQ